jgi:hypothetical protein
MPGLLADPGGWVMSNWLLVVVGGVLAVVAAWAIQESRREDDYAQAASNVQDKARTYTGGILGGILAFAFGIIGILVQAGGQFGVALDMLVDLLVGVPGLSGTFVVGVLGFLGMNGVAFPNWLFIGILGLVLALVFLARSRAGGFGA